ncbi:ribosome silencing factor [Planctomycetota bacterium]
MNACDTAIAAARLCDEHKAEDIAILDIRELAQFADYFVLCTGLSSRQLKAIAESVRVGLKAQGIEKLGREGEPASGWLLLDYVDVLVHIFSGEARNYYQLELLWGDAPRVDWRDADAAS